MEEKIKNFIEDNYKYILAILSIIIILLVLFIGIVYSKKVEKKVEIKKVIETKEEKKEVKKNLYVDIKGSIKNPGVYELSEESRVIDVINKAGGFNDDSDTSYINLSKKIKDEMVIIIYTKKEIEEYKKDKTKIKYIEIEKECNCPDNMNDACIDYKESKNNIDEKEEKNNNEITNSSTDNLKSEKNDFEYNNNIDSNNKISINEADINKLQELTGIGESKAKSIINYREENGGFKKIEDIMNVNGIGESLFEKIKDNITI